jgi:uncharacterized delta-60 repeat protein
MFHNRIIHNTTRTLIVVTLVLLLVLSLPVGLVQSHGDSFNQKVNHAAINAGELADNTVYLPLAMKNFPPIPGTPVLNAISNVDGDGDFTVAWDSALNADTYTLEEDNNSNFSNPSIVYAGTETSVTISGKNIGTYYYRVQAANAYLSSDWSNVEAVDVTVPPPECPQTVAWMGIGDEGRIMPFEIENSPQCRILADTLSIRFEDSCRNNVVQAFNYDILISGGQFDTTTAGGTQITGNFLTSTTLEATYAYESESGACTASGTWTAEYNLGANDKVYALAVQPNGKILVGGDFTTLGGQRRSFLGRLNADGSLDTTFNPEADDRVYAFAIQANGQIVVGGSFSEMNGETRYYIARLNNDGTLDSSFNPGEQYLWAGYDLGYVRSIIVQPDQKLVVGGKFESMAGEASPKIARLNPDGSADTSFSPELDKARDINVLALQSDNKIILGMEADQDDNWGQYVPIYRLNTDGSRDDTFSASLTGPTNVSPEVYAFDIQDNGKILIGGTFNEGDLIRINTDGSSDTAFNSNSSVSLVNSLYDAVLTIAVQSDGKILVGGGIDELNGEEHYGLGRLNADGTLDSTFNPMTNDQVNVLVVQTDGKILVGGGFFGLNGQSQNYIGRLNADGTLDTSFP